MKLTCLLLLICLTITCFGDDNKQPPQPTEPDIETSSDTLPEKDILLSTFVTFEQLFSDIRDRNAKKWEKQRVTIIAEVLEKEKHRDTVTMRFKTGVKGFVCLVSSTDKLSMSGLDLLIRTTPAPYKNALDEYTIGETYIFHLIIPPITLISVFDGGAGLIFDLTEDSFTTDDPFTIEIEDSDAKPIFTVMTVDILESVVEDLLKPTVQNQLWDSWNIRLTGEVKNKDADSLSLRTNDELLFLTISGSPPKIPLNTHKYQVGEEYTFDVYRGIVGESSVDTDVFKFMGFDLIDPFILKHR